MSLQRHPDIGGAAAPSPAAGGGAAAPSSTASSNTMPKGSQHACVTAAEAQREAMTYWSPPCLLHLFLQACSML